MEGTVHNFRRARHHQETKHLLIAVKGVEDREKAITLVGKKVVWKTPTGRDMVGKVAAAHGNKGVVRAIFEKGLPGQALGTKVKVE